jgi:hypothetical protein
MSYFTLFVRGAVMEQNIGFNPLIWISEQFSKSRINTLQLENTIPNQINDVIKNGHYILAIDSNHENILNLKSENISDSLFFNPLSIDSLETNIKFDAILIDDVNLSIDNILKIIKSITLLLKKSGIICFSFKTTSSYLKTIIENLEKRNIFNFDSFYDKEKEVVYLLFEK